MNDLLILSATAGAGALVGAALTGHFLKGQLARGTELLKESGRLYDEVWAELQLAIANVVQFRTAMQDYHDELTQAQNRIARALAQVTPGANATVKRMARMLRGEQA